MSDIRVFHEHTKLAILALLPTCIPIYMQFPSLFVSYDISKCDIRYHWVQADYISRFNTLLDFFISNGTAKTKLAILASLYCGEFVKNPISQSLHQ